LESAVGCGKHPNASAGTHQRTLTSEVFALAPSGSLPGHVLGQKGKDLHDLQLDYVRSQYGHPVALALVHSTLRPAASGQSSELFARVSHDLRRLQALRWLCWQPFQSKETGTPKTGRFLYCDHNII
jgi:hypothetical protein